MPKRKGERVLLSEQLYRCLRVAGDDRGLRVKIRNNPLVSMHLPPDNSGPRVSIYVGGLDGIYNGADVRFVETFGEGYSAVLAFAGDGIVRATIVTVDEQGGEVYPERELEYSPEDGCFYDKYAGKVFCPLEHDSFAASDIVSYALEECVDSVVDGCVPGMQSHWLFTGFCPSGYGNEGGDIVEHVVSCMEPLVRDDAVTLLSRRLDEDPHCRQVDGAVSSDEITYVCEVQDVAVVDGEKKDVTHIIEITLMQ